MLNVHQAPFALKALVRRWLRARNSFRIRELPCVEPSFVENDGPARINLVMLGVGRARAFGGVDTALRFFEAIRPHFPCARLVVLTENEGDFDKDAWPGWELESERPEADQCIAFLGDSRRQLQVRTSDRFVATHWRTAYYVQELNRILAIFGTKGNPYIYFIQDFEPGFYPWSDLYLLAEGTYRSNENAIAVFNTDFLRDYFFDRGYRFEAEYAFEPRLNPGLAHRRERLATHVKRRLLLVYGRPSAPRNAFDLAVESLRLWVQLYPEAASWDVLSLGETHGDIRIGSGLLLRSGGKLTLEEYSAKLLDASVGLSLMASPHPSYPPLEMAEFGVQVVTNEFANKSLADRSGNIVSVVDVRPRAIAEALAKCCEVYDRGQVRTDPRAVFLGSENEFPFTEALAARLLGPSRPVNIGDDHSYAIRRA